MIPRSLPLLEGLEVGSLYLPCGAVGGDLFDAIKISEDVLALVIFDVTGFGVPSALISAMAKVCFTNYIHTGASPRTVIERVNAEIINEVSADFYLTAFLGYLDLHDNTLTYCNGGHVCPVVYRAKQAELEVLKAHGTLLGVFDNGYYEEQSVTLASGDCLVLFTDGLYRLFSEDTQQGRSAAERIITSELATGSIESLLKTVRAAYTAYSEHTPIPDDISLLCTEVLTQSRRSQTKEDLGFAAAETVYLQFISYFEEMDRVIATVLSAMDNSGYPDDCIRKMKITLTELLVNAISHGNNKDITKKVVVGHTVDHEKTVVSIMDEGEGFLPASIPDPTLPENLIKPCGRGLFIVKHYVDSIEYNKKGNRVAVTKFHPCK